ncbi:hypothetical protein MLD38_032598 [Melastoma candidum]|uniref:Uncharacterized protein n=1 Tax=Melastoma candidum TaxID=119954 RepID=A0ACB9M5D5_9MYRT|nr:hypothetical protein MLD38_032598 [Melastoma candidum]
MATATESFLFLNYRPHNPSSFPPRRRSLLLLGPPPPLPVRPSPSLRFSLGLASLDQRRRPFVFSPAAAALPHEEDSNYREAEVEEDKDDLGREAKESEEAWQQTLATFKEQALKMQSVSQEAYDLYSKKAMVILRDTSEKLKIQAEKARYDLTIVAEELGREGKEYLASAAENSPDSVKDIVEAFSSPTENLNDISSVRDFYLGIPYGLLLSVGGFLSFMLTGSISAIRFGVILGGTLLALAVISLRSYKSGKPSPAALKGQAAIAGIISLREIRLLLQRPSFASFLSTVISVSMVVFYLYRIKQKAPEQRNWSTDEQGSET